MYRVYIYSAVAVVWFLFLVYVQCRIRFGEELTRTAYWRGEFGVAFLPVPLLGALPLPCRFVVGVVGVAVLIVGLFLLWMLLGLFLLLVADALGVVLVLVGLRNGALVLKVLGAAPLASFSVDPATRAEPGAHALLPQLGRRRSRMAMRSLSVPAGVCCVWGRMGEWRS